MMIMVVMMMMVLMMIILASSDLGDHKNISVGVDGETECWWASHPLPQAGGELLKN